MTPGSAPATARAVYYFATTRREKRKERKGKREKG